MKELDPLLHSQLRLSVKKTEATSGNLSVQIDKLAEAGYISVRKEIVGKKPRTTCAMTEKGRQAMDVYISTLREYLHI